MIKIRDLFFIKYGVNLEYNKMTPDKKGIPFVGRGSIGNGVVGFVKKQENLKNNPANTISVAGSGSVLESFLQEKPYYSGRDLYYLQPKQSLTKKQMLYYCMVLRSNKYRYSYGRQANRTLSELLIPSLEELPKWVNEIIVPKPPSKNPFHKKIVSLQDRAWGWFRYGDVLEIHKGKRLTKQEQIQGNIPYISSTASNNGVDNHIGNDITHKAPFITIACYGSIGQTFYQNRDSWVSDNCNILYLKNNILNQHIGCFLVALIRLELYRYGYGFTGKLTRLEERKIKLPINQKGKPDWQFMEGYIKSLPYSSNLKDNNKATT